MFFVCPLSLAMYAVHVKRTLRPENIFFYFFFFNVSVFFKYTYILACSGFKLLCDTFCLFVTFDEFVCFYMCLISPS